MITHKAAHRAGENYCFKLRVTVLNYHQHKKENYLAKDKS